MSAGVIMSATKYTASELGLIEATIQGAYAVYSMRCRSAASVPRAHISSYVSKTEWKDSL